MHLSFDTLYVYVISDACNRVNRYANMFTIIKNAFERPRARQIYDYNTLFRYRIFLFSFRQNYTLQLRFSKRALHLVIYLKSAFVFLFRYVEKCKRFVHYGNFNIPSQQYFISARCMFLLVNERVFSAKVYFWSAYFSHGFNKLEYTAVCMINRRVI